jgi:hypothetical protein
MGSGGGSPNWPGSVGGTGSTLIVVVKGPNGAELDHRELTDTANTNFPFTQTDQTGTYTATADCEFPNGRVLPGRPSHQPPPSRRLRPPPKPAPEPRTARAVSPTSPAPSR